MSDIPTFEEWCVRKYGVPFERVHMLPGMEIRSAMKELARDLQLYTTEMVQTALSTAPQKGTDLTGENHG